MADQADQFDPAAFAAQAPPAAADGFDPNAFAAAKPDNRTPGERAWGGLKTAASLSPLGIASRMALDPDARSDVAQTILPSYLRGMVGGASQMAAPEAEMSAQAIGEKPIPVPTPEEAQQIIEREVTGPLYKPHTDLGRITEHVGQAFGSDPVMGALTPGVTAISGLGAGFGSEVAGAPGEIIGGLSPLAPTIGRGLYGIGRGIREARAARVPRDGEILPPEPGPAPPPQLPPTPQTIEGEVIRPTMRQNGARLLPPEAPHEPPPPPSTRASVGAAGTPGRGPLSDISAAAQKHVRDQLIGEGYSPDARGRDLIAQRDEQMSQHQILGEVTPGMETNLGGLATWPGESRGIVESGLNARATEAPDRMNALIDRTVGGYQDLGEVERALKLQRAQASDPFYEAFRNARVGPTPQLDALMPRLAAAGALRDANRALAVEGRPQTNGFTVPGENGEPAIQQVPTAEAFQYAKESIDKQIAAAVEAGDGYEARRYTRLKSDLINAIDNHPDRQVAGLWQQARGAYAAPSELIAAQKLGEQLLSKNIHRSDLPELLEDYSPAQRRQLIVGLRGNLQDLASDHRSPARTTSKLLDAILPPSAQQKLRAVMSPEAVRELVEGARHEETMHGAPSRIVYGSATGARTTSREQYALQPSWLQSVESKDIPGISKLPLVGATKIAQAVQDRMRAKAEEKQSSLRADIAKIHMLQGRERSTALQQLLADSPGGPAPRPTAPPPPPVPPPPVPPAGSQPLTRKVIERGRSGRPTRTEPLPSSDVDQQILEKGYDKATENAYPSRVSTRLPTGKRSPENPLAPQRLNIDAEAMRRDPDLFRHNVDLVRQYPNLPKAQTKGPADRVAESFIDHVKNNLLWLHDQVPPAIAERSSRWYEGGHRLAHELADTYGVNPRSSAAAIAALSPQKDWYQNVSLAHRVHDIHFNHAADTYTPEMADVAKRIYTAPDLAALNKAITGKRYDELTNPLEKATWLRLYDQANYSPSFNQITPEGFSSGPVVTKAGAPARVAWGSGVEIAKAIQALQANGDLEKLTPLLGERHKVRSFYNNIIEPNNPHDVTIDTHAVAAGLLRPLSGTSLEVNHNFANWPGKGVPAARSSAITGVQGTYGLYADAYRQAAAERGILPRQMQSITWEASRGLFPERFKAQAKNVEAVDGAWRDYQRGVSSLDDTRSKILDLAGGVRSPDWFGGPDRELAEGAQLPGHAGELPADGIPGGGAESAPGGAGSGVAGGASAPEEVGTGTRSEGRGPLGAGSASEASRAAAQTAGPYPKLKGLPDKPIEVGDRHYVPGPIAVAQDAARDYMQSSGLPYNPPKTYQPVDVPRAERIAKAFDDMPHAPDDPRVKASYAALARETIAQWKAIEKTGLKVEWIKGDDPYVKTPRLAAMDVAQNNHLWTFPTEQGFGSGNSTEAAAALKNNPMLADTGLVIDGHPALVNDVFRIVHDYFGHLREGVGFRAGGEENAWRSHAAMYSPLARGAMTTETRGQNSWVNYGPHGETNRTASAADTTYAAQKVGLMPQWTWMEGAGDSAHAAPPSRGEKKKPGSSFARGGRVPYALALAHRHADDIVQKLN